jgi:hypothetical protein
MDSQLMEMAKDELMEMVQHGGIVVVVNDLGYIYMIIIYHFSINIIS